MKLTLIDYMAIETNRQGYSHWMSRLFLSGLLVFASLSFGLQLPGSEGSGYRPNHGPLVFATTLGPGSCVLAKTSGTIQLARKQVANDSGPDIPPKISAFAKFPAGGEGVGQLFPAPVPGYFADHILFRSGSRAISPRAPPMHFSG